MLTRRIKQQLTEYELIPEEWGGSTIFYEVSAINGDGVKELLEQVHVSAEMSELSAVQDASGEGVVIESRMERGRGSVATLLVKSGQMKIGDQLWPGLSLDAFAP